MQLERLESNSSIWWIPVLMFGVALTLRLAMALWLPAQVIWPDGFRYERVALNLMDGRGFGSLQDNRASFPTQPILIAVVFSLFGKSYVALRVFFSVIGAGTVLVCFALAKRLFGMVPALIAGFLLAIYPYHVYLSALFEYPQTFFILLMGLFFLSFFSFVESNRRLNLFLAGLSLGMAVLGVPTILIYIPFVFLCLMSSSILETTKRFLVLLIAILIPVGPWVVHNYVAYDRVMLVNAAGGINFWSANNETYDQLGKKAVVPACSPGYESTIYCEQLRALRKDLRDRDIVGVNAIFAEESAAWKKGFEFIAESPTRFAKSVLTKFAEFWSPIPNAVHGEPEHGGFWRDLISIGSYVPILILGICGALLSIRAWRKLMPVYLYFLALSSPYYLFLPTTRYRLPLDFFLIVFAGLPLAHWWERRRRSPESVPATH